MRSFIHSKPLQTLLVEDPYNHQKFRNKQNFGKFGPTKFRS